MPGRFGTRLRASAARYIPRGCRENRYHSKYSKWLLGYGPRQSTGVHDHLFHRIIMPDDGHAQFVLVSADLCLFSPTVYQEAAARLHRETDIPVTNIWWSVTHTHSAPEIGTAGLYSVLLKGRSDHAVDADYTEQVIQSLIDGVKEARVKLEPARLSSGTGLSLANINRRARDVNGRISLGMNPEGVTDHQIGLLRLERPNGTPIALIANYAMHGTVLGDSYTEISADAPGTVANYVEERTGVPMLYVNGAAGNLAPIYSVTQNPAAGHLTQFNVLIGDRILAAISQLSAPSSTITIWSGETIIETARKPMLGWVDDLALYAGKDSTGKPTVRLPIRFLKLGDTVIWSAPVELFCEIAIDIRGHSPFTKTFFFGYTNGWLGYFPTSVAFGEGGYEPATSPFTEKAEGDLFNGVVDFLRAIPR